MHLRRLMPVQDRPTFFCCDHCAEAEGRADLGLGLAWRAAYQISRYFFNGAAHNSPLSDSSGAGGSGSQSPEAHRRNPPRASRRRAAPESNLCLDVVANEATPDAVERRMRQTKGAGCFPAPEVLI